MQPENSPPPAPPPAPPPQQSTSNPYSFIYDNPSKPKKSLQLSGNSAKQRIMIFVAGFFVILIIGIVIMTFIGNVGKENVVSLTDAVNKQAEIIKITELASTKSISSTTKNLAATTKLILTTDQAVLLGILKTNGVALTAEELASKTNKSTTTLLANAEHSGTFEKVLLDELASRLDGYKTDIKKAYDSMKDEKSKNLLKEIYAQVEILTAVPITL